MMIAVRANVRTTKLAHNDLGNAFVVAFRGGAVLGFVLVGIGLMNFIILLVFYKYVFLNFDPKV